MAPRIPITDERFVYTPAVATDIRIRFAAVLGATAAIIAAEDFFLSWAGLDGEDREQTLRELNRLNLRILMLDEPQPE